jgi:hypothetical protein
MSAIDYEAESDKRLNWMDLTGGTAQGGMTMLDYFAGKALMSMLSPVQDLTKETPKIAAELAYNFAEAMLKERAKRNSAVPVSVRGVTGNTYG